MAIEKFPVEKSHVMMFSRSIGDSNKIYYDEDYAKESKCGGIIAPPTFVQSSAQFDPDYFLRPKEGKQWFGSAKGPTGITADKESSGSSSTSSGGLHAEQHYVFHKTLMVGAVLSAEVKPGKTWEKQGRKGGSLKFSETVTEYRDESGELVITATGVGVKTERPATTKDKG